MAFHIDDDDVPAFPGGRSIGAPGDDPVCPVHAGYFSAPYAVHVIVFQVDVFTGVFGGGLDGFRHFDLGAGGWCDGGRCGDVPIEEGDDED